MGESIDQLKANKNNHNETKLLQTSTEKVY